MPKMRIPKMKVPKRVAGFKVPKQIRKSALLRGLLASKAGREIAGRALVAGATAAAAALVAERREVAEATRKGARKGARTLGLLSDAAESAVGAAMEVVTDAARADASREEQAPSRKARIPAEAGKPH